MNRHLRQFLANRLFDLARLLDRQATQVRRIGYWTMPNPIVHYCRLGPWVPHAHHRWQTWTCMRGTRS